MSELDDEIGIGLVAGLSVCVHHEEGVTGQGPGIWCKHDSMVALELAPADSRGKIAVKSCSGKRTRRDLRVHLRDALGQIDPVAMAGIETDDCVKCLSRGIGHVEENETVGARTAVQDIR